MPITYPYLQYGGIWTTSQATDAVAAGTWPTLVSPTGVSATAGTGQATVSFTGVTATPAVTSYTATSSPGGFTASGSSSPLVVTGLSAGTPYTFTVKATNGVVTSAPSAPSNAVTPT